MLENIRRDGFVRVRVNGEVRDVTDELNLDRYKQHTIEIVVDRLVVRDDIAGRLSDSIQLALEHGNGIVVIDVVDGEELLFSEKLACIDCGISMEELTPRMFSFNSPFGACPTCEGLGSRQEIDPELVLDLDLSITEGD